MLATVEGLREPMKGRQNWGDSEGRAHEYNFKNQNDPPPPHGILKFIGKLPE
jgi:hypothetical protein